VFDDPFKLKPFYTFWHTFETAPGCYSLRPWDENKINWRTSSINSI